jgi:16S rRNA (guanine1516-N2)-methyltransferase
VNPDAEAVEHTWLQDERGLALLVPLEDGKVHPLRVDFLHGSMGYRLRHGGGRSQGVARAVGLKKGSPPPSVLDTTAGLGRDAFMLAWLGCKTTALERNPAVFRLLEDGLRRALADSEVCAQLGQQLTLVQADAREFMAQIKQPPQVVYLDPMHPERKKSAQVRKEMRLFRNLLGSDPDAVELFDVAMQTATRRVVVKRPRRGEALAPNPDHVVEGRTTRFDVYLIPQKS